MARDMVGAKIDLIVCGNNAETEAAKAASASIPIVMQVGSNPIERGLIASYAHPGGNITGLTWDQSPEFTAKSIELLKEVLPGLVRLGGLYDAGYPGLEPYRRAIEGGARRLGLTMHHADIRVDADLEPAIADFAAHDVQALYVYGSPFTLRHLPPIVRFCASRRLPDFYVFKEAVALGALMSYGVDIKTLFRRSALYVDKILRGAKPADLPVEQPTKYELVLNLGTAKARGLKIPQSLLLRADEVIE
jgi:putative ABC transport system substrate-binding protein